MERKKMRLEALAPNCGFIEGTIVNQEVRECVDICVIMPDSCFFSLTNTIYCLCYLVFVFHF